jgi:hypothetical protein
MMSAYRPVIFFFCSPDSASQPEKPCFAGAFFFLYRWLIPKCKSPMMLPALFIGGVSNITG